jgi:hypothetical protein
MSDRIESVSNNRPVDLPRSFALKTSAVLTDLIRSKT